MQTTFIYTLTCPLTKQIKYVGKSNDIKNRVKQHIYRIKHTDIILEKDKWIKDLLSKGLKPIIDILDEVPVKEWDYWERFWILTITSWGFDLVNIRKGGNGYGSHSLETIEKIRQSQSGDKNAMYGKKSPKGMFGKKLSEESKKKISDKKRGTPSWNKGFAHSEETKQKMREKRLGNKNPNFGKKMSEETKQKIKEKQLLFKNR